MNGYTVGLPCAQTNGLLHFENVSCTSNSTSAIVKGVLNFVAYLQALDLKIRFIASPFKILSSDTFTLHTKSVV